MALMVSISGIRGIVGETLTPPVATTYAEAFARYCGARTQGQPTIVVGRDGRVTGAPLADVVIGTLRHAGANVIHLGICPTPTVQLAVEKTGAAGGISITASHNPMEWNGMKFVAPSGMFLDGSENREFWELAEQAPRYAAWRHVGTQTDDERWIRRHIDDVLSLGYLRPDVVRQRRFKVVLDCVNAAGGVIIPQLLRELGCDVIEMNCDVSGVFQHPPEPIPDNLTDLASRVVAERADLGIAVDPDVDRLVLITEEGKPYSEEYTIASAVKFVLDREVRMEGGPGANRCVVVNLSTTRAVDDIAASYGARVERTPVGEINVAARMKAIDAVIGGEGSGGVILPAVHLGRDAVVGIGLILQLLAESALSLSALKSSLPQYSIAKGKIDIETHSPDVVLRALQERNQAQGRITTSDGLKIDFADSWVHLRKSNTEPIIRVIAEARSAAEASDLVRRFTREITSFRG